VPRPCDSPAVARRGLAVFIARPAVPGSRPSVRIAWLRSVPSAGSRALAAGITFTNRTLTAEWAGRDGHTSVIDATGAIYVIGGQNHSAGGTTFYKDVWASTNGGANRT
jgi:hypothetical protein